MRETPDTAPHDLFPFLKWRAPTGQSAVEILRAKRKNVHVAADASADLGMVRNAPPMIHAALALVLFLVATVLAVYKPRGVTRYGWRKQHEQGGLPHS